MKKESDHSRFGRFSRREHRCRPGHHRPGCGGSTPPSRRVRVANFYSEVPALTRRERGAIPRQPTKFRGQIAAAAVRRPVQGGEARLKNSGEGCREKTRFSRLPSRSPPGNFHAPVAQYIERRASNAEVAGEIPAGSAILRRVGPTSRGAPLRPERLKVRILHAVPFHSLP